MTSTCGSLAPSVFDHERPDLPQRYCSLMEPSVIHELEKLKVRLAHCFSNLSTSKEASEFVKHKMAELNTFLLYTQIYRDGLRYLVNYGMIQTQQYKEAVELLVVVDSSPLKELHALRRQRHVIEQDMEPATRGLRTAYSTAIIDKIMRASGQNGPISQRTDRRAFRKSLHEYYDDINFDGEKKMGRCPVSGRQPLQDLVAAHIVPRSWDPDQVSHILGVDVVNLDEPRNGLLLHKDIEKALDLGDIAIISAWAESGQPSRWRVHLVNERLSDDRISTPKGSRILTFRDIDRKELIFQNDNRPAGRYLFLRHIITFLNAHKEGNLAWRHKYGITAEFGVRWATPGPYLRYPTLIALAREMADTVPPAVEEYWNTFQPGKNVLLDEEYEDSLSARALNHSIRAVAEERRRREERIEEMWTIESERSDEEEGEGENDGDVEGCSEMAEADEEDEDQKALASSDKYLLTY